MTPRRESSGWAEWRLEPGEVVLAVGRVGVTSVLRRRRARATAGFVCVTPTRILWTDQAPGAERDNELPFDAVTAAREQLRDGHRWSLFLGHEPLERLAHVPAYHVWFIAGGNRARLLRFEETVISTSRRSTDAAIAIRAQLAARGIAIERLPDERSPGSRHELGKAFLRRVE